MKSINLIFSTKLNRKIYNKLQFMSGNLRRVELREKYHFELWNQIGRPIHRCFDNRTEF
jgi:hypothetical protein